MSDYKRLERMIRSLIPRFPRAEDRQYSLKDARNMINELGLQMPADVLDFLVSRDTILDDFINSIHDLEAKLRRKVVNDHGEIDEELEPKVYVEEDEVGFSVTHKGKEIVFAEYPLKSS